MRKLLLPICLLALGACGTASETCKTVSCPSSTKTYDVCTLNAAATYDLGGKVVECSADEPGDTSCQSAITSYCAS